MRYRCQNCCQEFENEIICPKCKTTMFLISQNNNSVVEPKEIIDMEPSSSESKV